MAPHEHYSEKHALGQARGVPRISLSLHAPLPVQPPCTGTLTRHLSPQPGLAGATPFRSLSLSLPLSTPLLKFEVLRHLTAQQLFISSAS